MSVISSTRGNPQASDVAVQTATPMLGGSSREDLQTVINSVDAEAAKLFEDRNIQLVDGGLITFTGTALQFTEALKLHINSQVAGGTPTVIDLAATTRSLSASGRMLYAVINRTAGTATVTADASSLPAVTSANQEVVLIAKRVDAGDGTQRCYFRNGATYNAGNTARLGSSGSGSGSGEINEIANSSDATNWVASGAGIAVATTTTLSDLPLNGVISTAIKVTPVSGTDYARYRWTAATSLKGKKLKIEWWQHALAGYAAGDLKLEVYKNSASDYSGSYTKFALSTDISTTSSIPAGDGKYTSSFDADTADYYEIRLVRTAGTSAITFANFIVGPGITAQTAAVAAPATLSTTYDNLGTVANNEVTYTRYGSRMKVQGRVTCGTTVAGIAAIVFPSGFTLNTGTGGLSNQASGIMVGYGKFITSGGTAVDQVPAIYALFYDGSTATKLFISDRTTSSAFTKRNGNDMFATGDIFVFEFDVPVAEWAGAGVINLGSNDVEYLTNTNTSTSASDTFSFGYTSGGVAFVAVSAAGSTIKKRVRAQRPLGANKGRPRLQMSPDGILWLDADTVVPYMEATSQKYGFRIVSGGASPTDMDVEFGGDGASGTEAWSVYTSWSWRVVVEQPGVAVGFGLANTIDAGLMSPSAQTLGGAKTFNDIITFKAAAGTVSAGAYDATGQWTFGPTTGGLMLHTFQGNADCFVQIKSGAISNQAVLKFIQGSTDRYAMFAPASSTDFSLFSYVQSAVILNSTSAGTWTFGATSAQKAHVFNGGLKITGGSTDISSVGTICANSNFGMYFRGIAAGSTAAFAFESGSTGGVLGSATDLGAWTLGVTGAANYTHELRNNSTVSQVVNIRNYDSTTSSDGAYNLQLIKGSTTNTAGTNRFILFQINAGGTNSGYIGSNAANAATFFSTSDQRMKKDVHDLTGALEKVSAMRPVTYKWKLDNSDGVGFLAQELVQVLPTAVVPTDDGTGTDLPENQEPWTMTESGFLPYLVKAIQELKAQHDELKTEYNAYKASHP